MSKIKYRLTGRVVSWIAVLVWLVVIFLFSSQPANVSNSLSMSVAEAVSRGIALFNVEVSDLRLLNHILRKTAHGVLYFVTALLVMNAFVKSGVSKAYTVTFLFCVAYAVFDEAYQLFVPGRGGQVGDVLINTAGALLGLGTYYMVGAVRQKLYSGE